ncbi:class I SAM-dependent DNA methyltransferase [Sulfurovum sp.]|uniref:HsdM family class I SAM-dependent methyltransferase n=1 Tax=Sulfurovum sp. TaxID=1969726 RepID=UPI00356186A4
MAKEKIIELRNQARKLSASQSDQINFARSFIGDILVSMYDPMQQSPIAIIGHPLGDEIRNELLTLDLDMASYLLGSIYTVMLPKEYRSKYGVFYTPPSLTERLLDMAEQAGTDWKKDQIIDPACGGGAFLAPIVKRMVKSLHGLDPNDIICHIKMHLYGLEIDPFSAWMTEVFVEASLKAELGETHSVDVSGMVRVCNSLQDSEDLYNQFDLVIGNPPYGKLKLEKEERKKWARSLFGHANLYGLFTDLALRLTNDRGAIAYVTPTSFLGGQYFKALRSLLLTEAAPVEIDFISKRDGVFADALQETLLAVYGRNNVAEETLVSFLDVQENGIGSIVNGGKHYLPKKSDEPWYLPRNSTQVETVSVLKTTQHKLADLGYEISTGPLVWNRHKDELFPKRKKGSVPVVWAECIDSAGSGGFAFKTTGKNHLPWYLSTKSNDPNVIAQECVLVQRTSSIEQYRRLVAAALPQAFIDENGGKVSVENHVNMIRPIKGLSPKISPKTLSAFLNTQIADQVFRCINGSTAVSAYELENMPLPAPSRFKAFDELVNNTTLTRDEIEALAKDMYINVCTSTAA